MKKRSFSIKNKILFLFLSFIALLLLTAMFQFSLFQETSYPLSPTPTQKQNPSKPNSESDSKALGKSIWRSDIIISAGKENYGRGGLISLSSTDDPYISLSGYKISGTADINLYEADENSLLDYLLHDKDYKQIKKSDISKFKPIITIKQDFSGDTNSNKTITLPLGETGIYFVRVTLGSSVSDAFIVRSDIGALLKEGDDKFIFWGQSFKTLKSIPGANIRLFNLLDKKTEISSSYLDSEGTAQFPISDSADVALVSDGKTAAIVPINLRYLNGYNYKPYRTQEKNTKYFLFTDRPIYRPGDTVYFKSIIRNDDDARYSIPNGIFRAKIYKDYDEKKTVFEKDYSVSSDGVINGEFKISENDGPGNYSLKVDLLNKTTNISQWDYWTENSISFMVEYYRKPEYSIDILAPISEYVSGDSASVIISGNYFSGQPLTNQKVKYKIYSSNFWDYEYYSDLQYVSNSEYRYGWWDGNIVDQNEAIFDQKGEARITLDTKRPNFEGKNRVYSIEAEFDDGSGNPSFARKNVLVYSGEYNIFRKNYAYGFKIDEKLSLPLILASKRGTNLNSINLNAKITRESWISYQEENKKYLSYKKETESLPDIIFTTDQKGEAELSFIPKKTGSYQIRIEGKDSRNNIIAKSFSIWVNDKNSYNNFSNEENTISLITDKTKYLPQDTMQLNISSSIPNRDVFLSIERGKSDRHRVIHIQGKSTTVDIPVLETDIPNIYASVSGFSQNSLDGDTKNIIISSDSKQLNIDISPDSKKYAPGDTAVINIKTTDSSGNPISAETALWVVDKAIFELTSENKSKIFDTFWKERNNNTASSHSLEGISTNMSEMGGCFDGETEILMGDKTTKKIKDVRKGDFILTRKNDNSTELIKTKVKNTHSATASGYLIINGNFKITQEHILKVNNKWLSAGKIQIGDKLTEISGRYKEVKSIEWIKGVFEVFNLEIEKYHTFFADGYFVHNQKGGGEARSVFKDTAYWNPVIHTDLSGNAQIVFKLPDNLTTWIAASIGSTKDTKVGQNTREIIVSKDVIIRPILPNLMRKNEKIKISALVQNFSLDDDDFDISLNFDSGKILNATYSAVTIKANETKQAYWVVSPMTENNKAKFTFSVKGTKLTQKQDTVVSEIPIRTFGFFENKGQTGNGPIKYKIALSQDAINPKTDISLHLSPSILGTLPSAMTYLVDYPYGCVEQTTSRFVPAIIAKTNPELFSQILEDKKIDEIINSGIKRLASLQQSDGGWTWWSSGNSNPFITSYVAEYLMVAKKTGYSVNEEMIEKIKNYLEQESTSGQVINKMTSDNRDKIVTSTYALSLMESEKGKKKLTDFVNISPDILSLAVITNIRNGDNNPESNGLSKLLSMQNAEGDGLFWKAGNKENFGSIDASTAFVIKAINASGKNRETAVKAANFLLRNKKSDYWSNTFATAQITSSIVDLSKTGSELNPNYSYNIILDSNPIKTGTVTDYKEIIESINLDINSIKPEGSTLEIQTVGEGQIYSTLLTHEYHTDINAKIRSSPLIIEKSYLDENGKAFIPSVGDLVDVAIKISGLSSEENYLIIEDELPSGMIPINEKLKNEQFNNEKGQYYDYYFPNDREFSENGIIMSVYRINEKPRIYQYKARVISEGEFIVPPATASLMYAPEISGRSAVQKITTVKENNVIHTISRTPTFTPPKMTLSQQMANNPGIIKIILITAGIIVLIVSIIVKKISGR